MEGPSTAESSGEWSHTPFIDSGVVYHPFYHLQKQHTSLSSAKVAQLTVGFSPLMGRRNLVDVARRWSILNTGLLHFQIELNIAKTAPDVNQSLGDRLLCLAHPFKLRRGKPSKGLSGKDTHVVTKTLTCLLQPHLPSQGKSRLDLSHSSVRMNLDWSTTPHCSHPWIKACA